jgi:hypothetical protein
VGHAWNKIRKSIRTPSGRPREGIEMSRSSKLVRIYLEVGKRRAFAGAIDWPGWIRSGPEPGAAIQSLFEYGRRYALTMRGTGLGYHPPAEITFLKVVEKLKGTSTTEFGAPDVPPSGDRRPLDEKEIQRFQTLLKACWRALDRASGLARGSGLRLGPRGGGRSLEQILQHLTGSDQAYLGRIGWIWQKPEAGAPQSELQQTRRAVLEAFVAAAHGELPTLGPRGGRRWTPRYFVRRVAWHTLDHAWEIEDRVR